MSYLGMVGDIEKTAGRSDGVFSLEWRIPDFLSLACGIGDRYQSPCFDFCYGRWCFKIFPNGFPWFRDEMVNLFLYRLDSGPPKTLNVMLGIRGVQGVKIEREKLQEFSVNDPVCFWSGLCRRSELNGSTLMPGNVLIISLEVKIHIPSILKDSCTQTAEESEEAIVQSEKQLSPEKQDSSTQTAEASEEAIVQSEKQLSPEKQGVEELQKSLQELLAAGEDSDVLIKVQGKEFPAHRAILRARSAVFHAMFSHDMVEKQSRVVTIEDCDPEFFPQFLEHVYTGSVEIISIDNVFHLYNASEKYDLNTLKKACTVFVKNNLSVSCFCDAITLAVKHSEKDLIELATEFFCNNTVEIFKTVEWQIFLKENTTIGNELLIKAFSK